MTKYFIRCERPQTEAVLEKYPNLTHPRQFTMGKMQTQVELEDLPKDTVKEVIENWAEKQLKPHDKIDYEETEEVNVVTQTKHNEKEDTTPVFEGEIEIPEDVRKQEEDEEAEDEADDSKSDSGSLGGGLM